MRLIAKGGLYNIALTGVRVFGSFFDDLICNLNQFHVSDIIVKTLEDKEKGKAKERRRCYSIFENEVQINTIKKRPREENKGACLTK